jgi:hypothetical protein
VLEQVTNGTVEVAVTVAVEVGTVSITLVVLGLAVVRDVIVDVPAMGVVVVVVRVVSVTEIVDVGAVAVTDVVDLTMLEEIQEHAWDNTEASRVAIIWEKFCVVVGFVDVLFACRATRPRVEVEVTVDTTVDVLSHVVSPDEVVLLMARLTQEE